MWLWLVGALAAERFELPVAEARDMEIVPVGARGVVVFAQPAVRSRRYTVYGFGPTLEPLWRTPFLTDRVYEERGQAADERRAWLLLQRGMDTEVLRADLQTGTVEQIPVVMPRRHVPEEAVADGTGGLWITTRRRSNGALCWMDPTGRTTTVTLPRHQVVVDLSPPRHGVVQAAVRDARALPGSPLRVLSLGRGAVVRETELFPDGPLTLLTGRIVALRDGEMAVGTWQSPGPGEGAEGIYVAGLEGDAQRRFAAFPFADMENALDFLGERRRERARQRLDRQRARGERAALRWNLLLHDPIATDEGFVLLAEAYYPVTRTEQRVVTVPDGRGGFLTRTETVTVFLGWRFTHVLALGFDDGGALRWDRALALGTLSPSIREHVRALVDDGMITLLYPGSGRLRRAVLLGGELLLQDEEVPVEAVGGNPHTLKNLSVDATWWYDDVFLLYGIDRVERPDGGPKQVFFLTTL